MYKKDLQKLLEERNLLAADRLNFYGQLIRPRRNAERRLTKAIGSRRARRQAKAGYRLKREAMGAYHED